MTYCNAKGKEEGRSNRQRLLRMEYDRFIADSDTYSGYIIYCNGNIPYNSLNIKYDTSD